MAKTYPVQSIINGQPTFEVLLDEILGQLKKGGGLKVLSPAEHITDRQRRWYRGICLRDLVKNDENGETLEWWDNTVKRECGGLAYLKKEVFFFEDMSGNQIPIGRLTIKGVGVKNMTDFIEEIISKSMVFGWDISPPDADLRK